MGNQDLQNYLKEPDFSIFMSMIISLVTDENWYAPVKRTIINFSIVSQVMAGDIFILSEIPSDFWQARYGNLENREKCLQKDMSRIKLSCKYVIISMLAVK